VTQKKFLEDLNSLKNILYGYTISGYTLNVFTLENVIPPPISVCVGKDSCTCEISDGSGTVNLHALDNPADPMEDVLSPTNAILYNPCSPMTNPYCNNNSLCEQRNNSLIPIGQASDTYFETGINGSLSLNYLSNNNVTSTINLLCDTNQRAKPFSE